MCVGSQALYWTPIKIKESFYIKSVYSNTESFLYHKCILIPCWPGLGFLQVPIGMVFSDV